MSMRSFPFAPTPQKSRLSSFMLYDITRLFPPLCLQVAFRMFALDVAMVLLAQEEREAAKELEADLAVYLSHRFLVRSVVYGRRSDVSPTVRAHAMHCLAQCLELPSQNATKWIHELFFSSSSTGMLLYSVVHFHYYLYYNESMLFFTTK